MDNPEKFHANKKRCPFLSLSELLDSQIRTDLFIVKCFNLYVSGIEEMSFAESS